MWAKSVYPRTGQSKLKPVWFGAAASAFRPELSALSCHMLVFLEKRAVFMTSRHLTHRQLIEFAQKHLNVSILILLKKPIK